MNSDNADILNENMWSAVRCNDLEQAEYYIAHGANIRDTDENGETVLHLAARMGPNVMVSMLLDAGANPNHASHDGVTPFMAAINAQMFANAQTLYDAGGDVNFQVSPDRPTPLILAINYDAIGLAKGEKGAPRTNYLLRYNADPDRAMKEDGRNICALDVACWRDDDLGRETFAYLFQQYLKRDVKAEFTARAKGAEGRARVRGTLDSKATGKKFKIGGP